LLLYACALATSVTHAPMVGRERGPRRSSTRRTPGLPEIVMLARDPPRAYRTTVAITALSGPRSRVRVKLDRGLRTDGPGLCWWDSGGREPGLAASRFVDGTRRSSKHGIGGSTGAALMPSAAHGAPGAPFEAPSSWARERGAGP